MDHGECARPCGKVRIARLNGGAITGHGARWPGATGRAALAAIGAVSGIGLSSGREYVLFFGQMGVIATVGVLAASAFLEYLAGREASEILASAGFAPLSWASDVSDVSQSGEYWEAALPDQPTGELSDAPSWA